jgi:tetratricopeptide (TPR) repeat protein
MKKIILSVLFAFSGWIAFSQDYSKVSTLYTFKKWEDAKKEIDKLASDDKAKDKPETLAWKANIYSEIYADSSLAPKYPDAGTEAYNTLQKYIAVEPSLKTLKESGLRVVGVLYGNAFNEGKTYFGESKWEEAYNSFKRAEEMSEFIMKNNLGSGAQGIDTFTVLYTGYSAQNSNKQADAVTYYEKLADKRVNGPEFKDIYRYMLQYYSDQKNTEKFTKYLALAKELYPNDSAIWSQAEMNNMSATASLGDILARYKQEDAAGKLTEDQYISFAENFAGLTKGEDGNTDSAQQAEIKQAGADAYKKAFNLNNKNGLYAYNAGVLYYSLYDALSERFFNLRGTSAELKSQRDEVAKEMVPVADSSIAWLEKAYEVLKAKPDREKTESLSLNRTVDYLAILYGWKRDKAKGVNPKDVDAFEAKYQLYDSEHDKYKQ